MTTYEIDMCLKDGEASLFEAGFAIIEKYGEDTAVGKELGAALTHVQKAMELYEALTGNQEDIEEDDDDAD